MFDGLDLDTVEAQSRAKVSWIQVFNIYRASFWHSFGASYGISGLYWEEPGE